MNGHERALTMRRGPWIARSALACLLLAFALLVSTGTASFATAATHTQGVATLTGTSHSAPMNTNPTRHASGFGGGFGGGFGFHHHGCFGGCFGGCGFGFGGCFGGGLVCGVNVVCGGGLICGVNVICGGGFGCGFDEFCGGGCFGVGFCNHAGERHALRAHGAILPGQRIPQVPISVR